MYQQKIKIFLRFVLIAGLGCTSFAQAKPPMADPTLIVSLTCGYDAANDRLVVESIDASDARIVAGVAVGDVCIDTYARLHAQASRASSKVVVERMRPGELAGSPAIAAPDCILFDLLGSGVHDGATVLPTSQAFLTCSMTANGSLALLDAEGSNVSLLRGLNAGMSCAAARAIVNDRLLAAGGKVRVSQSFANWFRSFNDPTGVVLHRIGLEQP